MQPVTPSTRTTNTEGTPGRPTSGAGRHRPRVLVCDSESQSLRALRLVLRSAGFEVDTTTRGKEALDRAALRMPDAALIELVLPDGDGVGVCREGEEVRLTPIEFKLLRVLVGHPGRLLTHTALLREVWGNGV
jgi:DNA-binding response OmpR family regulator